MNNLSDLWREAKSKDPGTELASVLDGARIMAQSLNPKVEVTFAGVKTANTDRKNIFLSPRELGNEYPISGDKVDVILGLTVHEVGHTLFSSNKVLLMNKLERMAGAYYRSTDHDYLEKLVNIFEDIYIDHLMTAYPGYRDYLQRERDQALGEFNPESVTKPLGAKCTKKDILNALIYFTLSGGKLPSKISDENMKTLAEMAGQANRMCTKKTSKTAAMLNAWKILKEIPTILTNEERGFGQPAPSPEAGEPQPASEKVQNHAKEEQNEQEKMEKQEELGNESSEENPKEETEEGESDAESELEKGEEEIPERDETEEESGESEPSEADEDEETEEGSESGEEGDIGNEATEGNEIDSGEEEAGESEVGAETDLDLASMLDDLVDDKTKLPEDLAEDVSEAIVEKRADITQLLSLIAKDSYYTIIAYTPKEDAERAAEARSQTAEAEETLRRILQDYRLRRTKDYRGLKSGRVSARRLYRAAYGDQRVFQRREKPEEIDMAICLLMDLSGSVYRYRELIDQIICAICDAFQKEKVEFIALGYSENHGIVNIPRLYDREVGRVNLGLTEEWQMTPSYEGLAAAIAQLLRLTGKKQKVLFHFTDGQPNSGNSNIIPDLLDDARDKGITDIHICIPIGDLVVQEFKTLYGEDTLIITDINQLPEVVETELRKRLQV